MAKHKYIFLLPLNYNDGSEVSATVRNQILERIYELAGGYCVAGEGPGAYRMSSGEKQVDRCAQIWISIDEEDTNELKQMVSEFAALLDQEEMYLEFAGAGVEFIKPNDKE